MASTKTSRIHLLRDTGIPDTLFLRVLRGRGDGGWHAHARHCLGLLDAGVRRIAFPDFVLTVLAGNAFFIPAATAHFCADSSDAAWRVFSFPRTILPGDATPSAPAVSTETSTNKTLDALLDRAEGGTLSLDQLADALRSLSRGSAPCVPRNPDLFDERIHDVLSSLAAERGYTPSSFSRAVRRDSGLSPSLWRLLTRLRLARALIDAGFSPAEAASGAGFADQAHLSRTFTRLLGMTPGEYRQTERHENRANSSQFNN